MRILVTGKKGQLGKSIKKVLNVLAKKDENYRKKEFLFVGREELNLASHANIDEYFANNENFDVVINCAAYTSVDKAEEEEKLANQINNLAVKQLAVIANKQKSKFIHISTDYVFDGKKTAEYLESDISNPINIYGKTKRDGEESLLEIMPSNAIIIRTSWVYSEYNNNFVKTMLTLGKERDELNVVGDQTGSPTYATDLAESILKILDNKEFNQTNTMTDIYHYSNGGQISWFDFSKEIFKIENIDCQVNSITTEDFPTAAKRPKNTSMNKNKIVKMFNLEIQEWKKSLNSCISNL